MDCIRDIKLFFFSCKMKLNVNIKMLACLEQLGARIQSRSLGFCTLGSFTSSVISVSLVCRLFTKHLGYVFPRKVCFGLLTVLRSALLFYLNLTDSLRIFKHLCKFITTQIRLHMSRDASKPVFGDSDLV